MNKLLNIMRMQSQLVSGNIQTTRFGIVSSYDPNNYAVKVLFQPDNTESGWLPIGTAWAGNGWGMFTPPPLGTTVKVHFQEGNPEAGVVDTSHYNDGMRPLSVPAGEMWLVHSSGSFVKINNDGTLNLSSSGALNISSGGVTNINSTGALTATASSFTLNGDTTITGNLNVTGDITDQHGSMEAMRNIYNEHTHTNNGGDPPQPQMPA